MEYIYDIVLDFNNNYYDFFEWDKKDKIVNVRKIGVVKINDNDYEALKYNDVIVNDVFIKFIIDTATVYFKNDKKYNCIVLVTSGKEVMGLLFNKHGKLLKRSGLIFDEAEEAMELVENSNRLKIKFVSNVLRNRSDLIPRREKEKRKELERFVENINDDIVKYLYYDYFEKDCNDTVFMKNEIIKIINDKWGNSHNKLHQLVTLIESGKKN